MTEAELNIDILKQSYTTLTDAWEVYQKGFSDKKLEEMISDSCVKRFEYTMETSLKIMRKFLKLEYGKDDKELTVNNIFRLMQGYSFISNWESWKEYYAKRNDASHEYNTAKARKDNHGY